MDVGGWAPGNMVSGIRPPSPIWPRCACAVPAAAIRARARSVRFTVFMVCLMVVMACGITGMWDQRRRQQGPPCGRILRSHDIRNGRLDLKLELEQFAGD